MFREKFIGLYKKAGFDPYEASTEVDFLLEVVAFLSSKDILLGKTPSEEEQKKIIECVEKRVITFAPIQHIVGQAYFMGDLFLVDETTLVPRPETEILVQEAISIAKKFDAKKVLDIGSGSGCIAIEIAKNCPTLGVDSVDISEGALNVARQNANRHGVFDRVRFYSSDVFADVEGKFDLIVSNPPYIPLRDKETLQKEVRDFEPAGALFADDEEGVGFYKRIIEGSIQYLYDGGWMIFELGINQVSLVEKMFKDNLFENIVIVYDLDGIARVIMASKATKT